LERIRRTQQAELEELISSKDATGSRDTFVLCWRLLTEHSEL